MRVSKAGLLVIAAIVVPIVVELRTALSWFGIELSVLESVGLAAVVILAIAVWAVWPPNGEGETDPEAEVQTESETEPSGTD